jgi:hypothetical protein
MSCSSRLTDFSPFCSEEDLEWCSWVRIWLPLFIAKVSVISNVCGGRIGDWPAAEVGFSKSWLADSTTLGP